MARFPDHPARRPAVITGASSGIGAATAQALADAGHPLALGARRVDRCEALAATLPDAAAFPLDVNDPASIEKFAADALSALGDVEILVLNAGDTGLGQAVDMTPAEFGQQVQVNLAGAQHLISLLVPAMIERRRGDVVLVTSDAVAAPRPGIAGYLSAKFGLEGLATAMQMELEGSGVRASIVRPGPTLTEMGRDWDADRFTSTIDEWVRWGVARHDAFLQPANVASAIAAVVAMPRGAHITLVQVEPEAPIRQEGE